MIGVTYGVGAGSFGDPLAPLYMGCEFEIEDIKDHGAAAQYVNIESDGSLRNNGYEYITKPLVVADVLQAFKDVHKEVKYGENAFTERTSIHVHVNCCNLTEEEVRNIVLLYALFEEGFFAMVTPGRRDNIHCVALTETFLPGIYRTPLRTMGNKWHKYTALNLKPLAEQGTVEFRHMHGHGDYQLFAEWISLLNNLFVFGRGWKVSADNLEEAALEAMFRNLFSGTHLSSHWYAIRGMMDNQIIDVKLSTL